MVHNVKGNLLHSQANFICHQVNCQKVMGSGVAKQIKEAFPKAYEDYIKHFNSPYASDDFMGDVTYTAIHEFGFGNGEVGVLNMFCQDKYGRDSRRYTNYEAFYNALTRIVEFAELYEDTYGRKPTIAFPYKIGCDRGGGNWTIISTMIEEVLGKNYEVYIYELEV